ncbi:hypothetical protein PsorP6_009016 [Peronosclerospora sorghi]|uniref:Uncharacterized protein n=1 Tax=Peronosclerospora sorghi TaxID=230839 RepID=A0ACC0VXW3_9STRA|nr:hypothetical protein PsorP6_009016 [Peronosclerospora sorghi]
MLYTSLVISAIVDKGYSGPCEWTNPPVTCRGPSTRTQPPLGAVIVDASGAYNGSFLTISEAVMHLRNTTDEQTLFVFPGVYIEQVIISKLNGPLVLQGYTCDTMSYAANQVTLTQAKAQRDIPPSITTNRNDQTSTLLLKTHNVKIYNLNVANTAGEISEKGQAVAISIQGQNYGIYACTLSGYQDTVYANKGPELIARTYIIGAVDFIFGALAPAWFQFCDIEVIGEGCITANGRTNDSSPSFYVFDNARVFGSSGNGSGYLGRPWRKYARVVWQNSELGDIINSTGWREWGNDTDTANVYFKEFNNSGPGAATKERVPFSGQLTAPIPITQILGENYLQEWFVDSTYL